MPNFAKTDRYQSCKPFTRWWWFSGPIERNDVTFQLEWLKQSGFGGVEIAWVYPQPGSAAGPKWLSSEWSEIVAFAKREADRLGLGCDFTFGTLWPFGGSIVPEEDASRVFGGFSEQRLNWTWEKEPGLILNHLDRKALGRYCEKMGTALKKALEGSISGLFCDSWEVEAERLWTEGFDEAFKSHFEYAIEKYITNIDEHPDVRYDYRKLIAKFVLDEFYRPFDMVAKSLGGFARVQCHGAPTDLLAAYASVDVPETEAILFPPTFAKIAASAAALAGKPIVSCETFTCLYGWKPRPGPAPHIKREQVADMKLLANSLFANGVNQIFWHGMPYNPKDGSNEFYATVHVGPDSGFADEIPSFNHYMRNICSIMRRGKPYSDVAVLLPVEDAWMAEERTGEGHPPDAKYVGDFRYEVTPDEIGGSHPLWVSGYFLKDAKFTDRFLQIGDMSFRALYVNSKWLDETVLDDLLRLALAGLPTCLKQMPRQPGKMKSESYGGKLAKLIDLPNVSGDFGKLRIGEPLLKGNRIPEYWSRVDGESLIFFFANPKSKGLKYPMSYGQSFCEETIQIPIEINSGARREKVELVFEPYQSVLFEIGPEGSIRFHDIKFMPKTPITE